MCLPSLLSINCRKVLPVKRKKKENFKKKISKFVEYFMGRIDKKTQSTPMYIIQSYIHIEQMFCVR